MKIIKLILKVVLVILIHDLLFEKCYFLSVNQITFNTFSKVDKEIYFFEKFNFLQKIIFYIN